MKILVAYFSAQGTTKKLAETLAGQIGADLYEIVPVEPYEEEDLDWRNQNSRSSLEMTGGIRPDIKTGNVNVGDYDVIFLGYPIWWYEAPTAVNAFLEAYDFAGKKIVPFATSGSSGIGDTAKYLGPSCKDAAVLKGQRFDKDASAEELKAWAEKFIEEK